MSNIAEVIGWKFNHQSGMSTKGGKITKFPGGVPSQEDQDAWTVEYDAAMVPVNLDKAKQKFYEANGQTESAFIRALLQERSPENDSAPLIDFFAKRLITRNEPDFPK